MKTTKQKVLRYHETFCGGYAATLEINPARLPHVDIEWTPTVPTFKEEGGQLLAAYRVWRDAVLQDVVTQIGLGGGGVAVVEVAS